MSLTVLMSSTAKNICIIPARGGSKRIPGKNIKNFLGKPIIAYSIEAALNSEIFDVVMVSTDDEEIANIAEKYGAEVPFLRSAENADDFATTLNVLAEVIGEYRRQKQEFINLCCIYPCAPFVTSTKLKEAFELMTSNSFDSVFPVMPFGFPVQRSLKMKDGKIQFAQPEFMNSRSQDMEKRFHDAGQFYFMNIEKTVGRKIIITDNSGAVLISELEGQDIDNETDWKLAELKYKLLHSEIS